MAFFEFFQSESAKETWKRIGALALVVVVVGFFVNVAAGLYSKSRMLKGERQKKEEELSLVRKENERLRTEIQFLGSESALEREAKSRLNYKKPGEEVVIIVPPEEKQTATTSPVDESWWGYFKNLVTSF